LRQGQVHKPGLNLSRDGRLLPARGRRPNTALFIRLNIDVKKALEAHVSFAEWLIVVCVDSFDCKIRLLAKVRSVHRFGVDPISRVRPYRSEIIIIRLGLIKISRIEAEPVGRSQFPVVDVTHVKATARATPRGSVMAHMDDRRRRQFSGNGRDGHR